MANEKRLIDADALKEQIAKEVHTYWTNGTGGYYIAEDVIPDIDNAPTVDAVEVVRCKDCKHRGEEYECPMYFVKEIEWDDDGYTECDYVPYDRTVDDGFCDRGERSEGE